jgi:hypothetical protein
VKKIASSIKESNEMDMAKGEPAKLRLYPNKLKRLKANRKKSRLF